MLIRLADEDDMAGLLSIEEDSFGSEKFPPDTIRAFIYREDTFILVAIQDEGIIGSAMCIISELSQEGRIASVAVLSKYRRSGIGSSLLKECERIFESKMLRRYTLEVDTTNEAAIALYSSRGYVIKGMIRDFYGSGRNAYSMEKRITGLPG